MMYRRLAERYLDELGRIAITGTMGWRWQMGRLAHEVALGIWLAGL